jgi:Leucine-rich repeat (LRR) protein
LYGSPQIDDDGLTLLRNQSLESLSIDDAPITGSFCQRGEGRWPRLLSLSLVNTQIDDSHLSVILDGRNLESLGVTGSPVTFESTSFPAMPRLITLSLGGTAISDSGVKNVVELFPFLRWLKLSHTSISDASVQEIAKLSHLDVLNVDGTSVSSKGLMELMNHKNIYTIYAKGCEISNSCISALKFSCPNMYKIFT